MKVIIFTNHFYPEGFKVNDVAFDLSERGWNVKVITGIPNYPGGRFYSGYGFFKRRKEVINGVKVIHMPLVPRGNGSRFRLILNYCSFLFFVSIYAFYIGVRERFDCILVHHTSPITIGIPAIIVKKFQRIKLIFWNLDLWPESVVAAGKINNQIVNTILLKLVRLIYKNADTILISSKGFTSSIVEKGVPGDKLVYFPNWAEDCFIEGFKGINDLNVLNDVDDYITSALPEGFKVMFAGNIGEAQDFHNILSAAELLKDTNIKWVIIGDGRKRGWIENEVKKRRLKNSVFLLGRYPIEKIPYFFHHADVLFFSLKDEFIFSLTVPAKVQAYMASGKPIIAMVNGEAARLIEEAGCGASCHAGNYKDLAKKVLSLSKLTAQELKILSDNARKFYTYNFDKKTNLDNLASIIEETEK